jgi:hypothetical protein
VPGGRVQKDTCSGTLTLSAKVKGRTRRIGGAKFSFAAGKKRAVRVRLSKAAAKAIRRKGKLNALAATSARDGRGGDPVRRSRTVTLKR